MMGLDREVDVKRLFRATAEEGDYISSKRIDKGAKQSRALFKFKPRYSTFSSLSTALWRIPQNWTGHLLQKPNFGQISNKTKYVVLYIS